MNVERTRWGKILLLWVVGLGAGAQYAKISVIIDDVALLYPNAGFLLGFTLSVVGIVGIVFGVVAGAVVSATGYRRALVLSLWLGAALSAIQAMGLPLGLFLLSRALEGVPHLALVVAAPTLISLIASEKDSSTAMTLWSTFFGICLAVIVWVGGPLVAKFGVYSLFWAHAAMMAGLAMTLPFVLRDVKVPPRGQMPTLKGLPSLCAEIYTSARLSTPAVAWLFYTMCFLSVLTVLPAYLPAGYRAFVIGAMPLVSIASSLTLGVFLLRKLGAVVVLQIGFTAASLGLGLVWFSGAAPWACFALAAAFGLNQGAGFASVPELNKKPRDRALANGAMAQMGNAGNVIGTPLFLVIGGAFGLSGLALAGAIVMFGAALCMNALARQCAKT